MLEPRTMLHGADFTPTNPIVTINFNVGSIDVELFRETGPTRTTPIHADNFLGIANRGEYDNSFFHRSRSDFVIQGGGFISDDPNSTDSSSFDEVPFEDPDPNDGDVGIENEPGNSNVRGAIALARSSQGANQGVNSGTTQFFFNVVDNLNLDSVNGGFTAFGRIVGDEGLALMDLINSLDTFNLTSGQPIPSPLPGPFEDLFGFVPYTDDPRSASDAELVFIESITGTGVIHGTKYNDLDGDGQRDENEPGLEGFTIYIDANENGQFDEGELSATTDSEGVYHLEVESGTHIVREAPQPGFVETDPTGPEFYEVEVLIGGNVEDIDFGNFAAEAAFHFATFDLQGNPQDTFNAGETFVLTVSVEDLRGPGENRGVAAAYLDVIYNNSSLISPAAPIEFNDVFNEQQRGDTGTSGLIDEAGAATFSSTTLGLGAFELFSLQFQANSSGEVTFIGNAADDLLINETLFAQPPAAPSSIFFGGTAVTILRDLVADNDEFAVPQDEQSTLPVLDNDSDNVTIIGFAGANHGQLAFGPDNLSILYTPEFGYVGPDSFTYTIRDLGTEQTATATVTLDVQSTDFPVAVDDTITRILQEATPLDLTDIVLANDLADPQGGTIRITAVSDADIGSVVFDNDRIVYTPSPTDLFGTATFTYTITDDQNSDTATVTVRMARANDDQFTIEEDETGVFLRVLDNDTQQPPVSETLEIISTTNPDPTMGTISVVEIDDEFGIRFDAAANVFDVTPTFTYTISDGVGGTSTATVEVTIQAQNDPPNANNDTADFVEDGDPIIIEVLANDTFAPDIDETLQIISVSSASRNGSVEIIDGGTRLRYQARPNVSGTETFTYTISDGALTDTARVTVTIEDKNDPPTAEDDEFTVLFNSSGETLLVLANDSFAPDTDETLTLTDDFTQGSEGGQVSLIQEGESQAFRYIPPRDFVGTETFTYTITDGDANSTDTATVTITVTQPRGSIAGSVFFDEDDDGVHDPGEAGIGGVQIELLADGQTDPVATITTDGSGEYFFENVEGGDYTIRREDVEFLIPGDAHNADGFVEGNSLSVTLEDGENSESNNFTYCGRDPSLYSLRDLLMFQPTEFVWAAFNEAGETLWYSFGDGWDNFTEITAVRTGRSLQLTATGDVDGGLDAEQTAAVLLNDSERLRRVGSDNGAQLVQFIGGFDDFGFQAANLPPETSPNEESSTDDSAPSEAALAEAPPAEASPNVAVGKSLAAEGEPETTNTPTALGDVEELPSNTPVVAEAEGESAPAVSSSTSVDNEAFSDLRDQIETSFATTSSQIEEAFDTVIAQVQTSSTGGADNLIDQLETNRRQIQEQIASAVDTVLSQLDAALDRPAPPSIADSVFAVLDDIDRSKTPPEVDDQLDMLDEFFRTHFGLE